MTATTNTATVGSPPALRLGYPLISLFFRTRGMARLREQRAVLVYQMAKVGSTTVVRTLRASRPRMPVFHVHTLTATGIATLERFYRGLPFLWSLTGGHVLVSRYLREQLRRGVSYGRWKVVTMVRDPIARNISLLFQLGPRLIPDFAERCDAGNLDPVRILDQFERAFPSQIDCMHWFRNELAIALGVDPFAQPFDRVAGHQVYGGPVADVLLIRTEDLDGRGEAALTAFLGLDAVRWRRANVGTQKSHGGRYSHLLARLRLPAAYVDRYYDSPEVRHFYSPAELDRFRSRWCGTPGVSP